MTSTTTKTEPIPNALRITRFLKAPPERVYKAYLDPDALAKWIPPNGFTGHVYHLDARVGGTFRMSFSTINRSWTSTFGGKYLELRPFERIVHTDKFEDPALSQIELKVTVTLKAVPGGTELTVVQEGLDKMPKEMSSGAPEGWKQSIENLARLVEAEVPF
ncbi:MAG: SRPBCC domain-containing protein [Methanobacteriota archaeon]